MSDPVIADTKPAPKPAVVPAPGGYSAQPPVVKPLHTDAEAAELEALYAKLKPEAIEAARTYVLARTPPQFQLDMIDLIAADFPPPPPPEPPVA